MLEGVDLAGFHCTRLHELEIADILSEGLQPLSAAFLERRIQRLTALGTFRHAIGERLCAEHEAPDSGRAGMVWFVFSRSLLRDETSMSRFFRSWGGEALYWRHEEDPETGPVLRRVGVPCIVEAALAAHTLGTIMPVAERVVTVYLRRRRVRTAERSEMEGWSPVAVGPERIRRIVRLGERDFARLTRCHRWEDPLATAHA
jgi:hypothetical protein